MSVLAQPQLLDVHAQHRPAGLRYPHGDLHDLTLVRSGGLAPFDPDKAHLRAVVHEFKEVVVALGAAAEDAGRAPVAVEVVVEGHGEHEGQHGVVVSVRVVDQLVGEDAHRAAGRQQGAAEVGAAVGELFDLGRQRHAALPTHQEQPDDQSMYYLKCSLAVKMVSEHFWIMTSIH